MGNAFVLPSQATTTDFGLNDAVRNSATYARLASSDFRTVVSDQTHVLGHLGNELFVVNKVDRSVTYYATYSPQKIVGLGSAAADFAAWRRAAPGIETISDIVLDHLLAEFDAVVSDTLYTDQGLSFWINCLGKAADGYGYGKACQAGYIKDGSPVFFPVGADVYPLVHGIIQGDGRVPLFIAARR